MQPTPTTVSRKAAVFSVFDKNGMVPFAQALVERGLEIWSSGGTHRQLVAAGVPSRDVSEMVGEQILGDRVKTLSREIHAGLLAQLIGDDLAQLERMGVPVIDVACLNFYPLEAEIAREGSTPESVLEKTDIGGPTMARSGAKGRRIVVCDPKDYDTALQILDLEEAGNYEQAATLRTRLAAKAEGIVASYCLASARYTSGSGIDGVIGTRVAECLYGENAWQKPAALYNTGTDDPLALPNFRVIAGAKPSFNNWIDCDRLLQTVTQIAAAWDVNFGEVPYIAVSVKHGNACGGAVSADPRRALEQMVAGDPRALMGGLVKTNFPIDENLANILAHFLQPDGRLRLLDGVFAPDFTPEAIRTLERRKTDKCRFIVNPALAHLSAASLDRVRRIRPVRGGFLTQPNYTFVLNFRDPRFKVNGEFLRVLGRTTTEKIILARAIAGSSTSNTITLTTYGHNAIYLIGNGVGRQDRVGAAELAVKIARDAGHSLMGAAAASDSFFPFSDGPKVLVEAGVTILFATTGSVNDTETIEYCKNAGITFCSMEDKDARGFSCH